MSDRTKVELTDTEWMELINKERNGLGVCCANISNLRDYIIDVARNDGETSFSERPILRAYHAAYEGHDMLRQSEPLEKFITQVADMAEVNLDEFLATPHNRLFMTREERLAE